MVFSVIRQFIIILLISAVIFNLSCTLESLGELLKIPCPGKLNCILWGAGGEAPPPSPSVWKKTESRVSRARSPMPTSPRVAASCMGTPLAPHQRCPLDPGPGGTWKEEGEIKRNSTEWDRRGADEKFQSCHCAQANSAVLPADPVSPTETQFPHLRCRVVTIREGGRHEHT